MLTGFFGNLIFAIIARMLCGNHHNFFHNAINLHPCNPQQQRAGTNLGALSYLNFGEQILSSLFLSFHAKTKLLSAF